MNDNNIKILIMGRTGSGKDYLASLLKKEGLTQVLSYTTRPKRKPDENTHIFITPEEAQAIPAGEKVATTVINGYEYFATRQQVEDSDVYIIDPKGFYELRSNMPGTVFVVIYVDADKEYAKERAAKRASDSEAELEIFEQRYASEDEQFTAFEKYLEEGDDENFLTFIRIRNDFETDGVFRDVIRQTENLRNTYDHLLSVVRLAKQSDLLYLDDDGLIQVFTQNTVLRLPESKFAERMLHEPEGVGRLMLGLFSRRDVCVASGFSAEIAETAEAEEITGYIGEIVEALPATEETTDARIWLQKQYDKAAKYLY